MYQSQTKGFTLVELMIVVTIVAVLAAIALPSFQSSMRSTRVATTSNELMAAMALARSEAIRSTRGAGVCTSADGFTCGGDWNSGWLVWTDTVTSNGVMDAGEPVARYVQAKENLVVSGSAVILGFDARGRSMAGAQTIGLHPKDVTEPARCVRVTVTGQVRIEKNACS